MSETPSIHGDNAATDDSVVQKWRTPFYSKLKQLNTDITTFKEESRGKLYNLIMTVVAPMPIPEPKLKNLNIDDMDAMVLGFDQHDRSPSIIDSLATSSLEDTSPHN